MHVLVLGSAGSGKSYLAKRMKAKGFYVIDEGWQIGLAKFANKRTGRKVRYDPNGGKKWWGKHNYVHDIICLKRLLKKHKTLYVIGLPEAGLPGKKYNLYKMFGKLYYLDAPKALIKKRLMTRKNNVFGKNPEELKIVLENKARREKRFKKLGLKRIDATLPISKIIKIITS